MRFINYHEIAPLYLLGAFVYRLDSTEKDLRVQIATVQPSRVDAGWRVGPYAQQCREVLLDKFL